MFKLKPNIQNFLLKDELNEDELIESFIEINSDLFTDEDSAFYGPMKLMEAQDAIATFLKTKEKTEQFAEVINKFENEYLPQFDQYNTIVEEFNKFKNWCEDKNWHANKENIVKDQEFIKMIENLISME
jgi:hypothetical protein